jgi:hypothetical protein
LNGKIDVFLICGVNGGDDGLVGGINRFEGTAVLCLDELVVDEETSWLGVSVSYRQPSSP